MINKYIICPECKQPTHVEFDIPDAVSSEEYRGLGADCERCSTRLTLKQVREAVPARPEKADMLNEAKDLLENYTKAKDPPENFDEWSAPAPLTLVNTLAQLSIAESLSLMSNDLASLCDLLTDMLQQQEADRNRRDLQP